ncbi:hypothetical protein CFIO01_07092 [Colletotrichum fioriniae PJ7]|uniref:Uncharacterized protein n=1 Tax=Colletotrichum fioriniae PJ7 TaxID=1445577 RepID=A0A010R5J2_9PEZI|nr:hypothetical protein CFIO01_07092 [Colletotrichum fioriniae PJ7]
MEVCVSESRIKASVDKSCEKSDPFEGFLVLLLDGVIPVTLTSVLGVWLVMMIGKTIWVKVSARPPAASAGPRPSDSSGAGNSVGEDMANPGRGMKARETPSLGTSAINSSSTPMRFDATVSHPAGTSHVRSTSGNPPPVVAPTMPSTTTTPIPTPRASQRPLKVILTPRFPENMSSEAEIAPNAVFTLEEKKVLKKFVRILKVCKEDLFDNHHFDLPRIVPILVSVSSTQTRSQIKTMISKLELAGKTPTRIRIDGLHEWGQIRRFHKIMSRNRHIFAPLHLCYHPCYHKKKVLPAALGITCAIRDPVLHRTLCGSLVIVQTPSLGQRTSTIGGLLSIRGSFYALTTSHMPQNDDDDDDDDELSDDSADDEENSEARSVVIYNVDTDSEDSDSLTPSGSDDGASEERELMRQLQETVSLDDSTSDVIPRTTEEVKIMASRDVDATITTEAEPHSEATGAAVSGEITPEDLTEKEGYLTSQFEEDDLRSGDDWLLLPVENDLLLPNRIPEGMGKPTKWQNPFIEGVCSDLDEAFGHRDKSPSAQAVWTISGRSGLLRGRLCPDSTFMISRGGKKVQEVWIVELDDPSQDFQAGDSGSWVVDTRLRRVLGILVARSYGVGYIVSFAKVRQNIASTLRIKEKSVKLAYRMDPLILGRGGGEVLRSLSPIRPRSRQEPIPLFWRLWGLILPDSVIDIVRYPQYLGIHTSVIVVFGAIIYMFLMWQFQFAWYHRTTVRHALLPSAFALFLWVLAEADMLGRPRDFNPDRRLAARRLYYSCLRVMFWSGVLGALGIYSARRQRISPFTLLFNITRWMNKFQQKWGEMTRAVREADSKDRDPVAEGMRNLAMAWNNYVGNANGTAGRFSMRKWLMT